MLLLGDHLQQDAARDVVLRLLVYDDKLDAFEHERANVAERDVLALHRVVETSVRVLLDYSWFAHAFILRVGATLVHLLAPHNFPVSILLCCLPERTAGLRFCPQALVGSSAQVPISTHL